MSDKLKSYSEWYNKNCKLYESCGHTIQGLISTLLDMNGIPYHSINHRVKSEQSFINKCKSDKYSDPISQITDVCGIRIITYTNKDVETIQALIEREFNIDKENSVDKMAAMKDDQVGYLSVHYIAMLGSNRTSLNEYRSYGELKFEIQIRTLLQHAWAEIEHDRNYKFSGELPREIKRRFYLVSGALELLDREFQQLSDDIDNYAENVRESTKKGELNNPIDSTSLMQYLTTTLSRNENIQKTLNGTDKEIIMELSGFGIETLKDLDVLIKNTKLDISKYNSNYAGFLRGLMMAEDPNKYFKDCWNHHWSVMKSSNYDKLMAVNAGIAEHKHLFSIKNQLVKTQK